jgi:hypothetical protein
LKMNLNYKCQKYKTELISYLDTLVRENITIPLF